MPDYCFNSLKIGSNAKEILNAIKGKDTCFDFHKVIPMPEELVGTTSPSKHRNPELVRKYGYDNWYDWSNANWDTKWNAIDTKVQGDVVHFLTAWGPPLNVIVELSKKYPNVEFHHYFDLNLYEGPGHDTKFLNGVSEPSIDRFYPLDSLINQHCE